MKPKHRLVRRLGHMLDREKAGWFFKFSGDGLYSACNMLDEKILVEKTQRALIDSLVGLHNVSAALFEPPKELADWRGVKFDSKHGKGEMFEIKGIEPHSKGIVRLLDNGEHKCFLSLENLKEELVEIDATYLDGTRIFPEDQEQEEDVTSPECENPVLSKMTHAQKDAWIDTHIHLPLKLDPKPEKRWSEKPTEKLLGKRVFHPKQYIYGRIGLCPDQSEPNFMGKRLCILQDNGEFATVTRLRFSPFRRFIAIASEWDKAGWRLVE